MMLKWDLRFLGVAELVSTWSKDPSTRCGAVAVNDRRQILSTGFNGLARGLLDTDERLNDRDFKYAHIIHAEMNCVFSAAHNGVSLDGSTIYVHGLPMCSDCAKSFIQVGVKRVVMRYPMPVAPKWAESFARTKAMFDEVGIISDYYTEGL